MNLQTSRWVMLVVAVAACGTDGPSGLLGDPDSPAGPSVRLTMVSGDRQAAKAGQTLGQPFVVRVTDALGVGIPNVSITWTVTLGEGVLNGQWQPCPFPEGQFGDPIASTSVLTNGDGLAQVSLMPTAFVPVTVAAKSAGIPGSPVTFTIDATDAGARIEIVSENDQEGMAGAWAGPNDFKVRVVDGHGTGVLHVPVRWSVTSGIGLLRVDSGCSDGRVAGDNVVTRTTAHSSPAGAGYTGVTYFPHAMGISRVAAVVPGASGPAAVFTVSTTSVLIGLSVDPWLGGGFVGPGWKSDVTVPVGTTVKFLNDNYDALIKSSSAPSGGTSFEAKLGRGETFVFVPEVPGTWSFVDELTGATGTLTAQ